MSENFTSFNDQALALEAQGGALCAFEELVRRYEVRIYNYCKYRLKNSDDGRDAAQLTFVKAWQKLNTYKQKHSFSSWLHTIARNECINIYRKNPASCELEDALDDRGESPRHSLERNDSRENIWARVRQLISEEAFSALWLLYQENLTLKQIGQTLKKSEGSVKVMLHRTRKQLAEKLGKDSDFMDLYKATCKLSGEADIITINHNLCDAR